MSTSVHVSCDLCQGKVLEETRDPQRNRPPSLSPVDHLANGIGHLRLDMGYSVGEMHVCRTCYVRPIGHLVERARMARVAYEKANAEACQRDLSCKEAAMPSAGLGPIGRLR